MHCGPRWSDILSCLFPFLLSLHLLPFMYKCERQCACQAHRNFIFSPQNHQIQVSVAVAVALRPPPGGKWHLWLLKEHRETALEVCKQLGQCMLSNELTKTMYTKGSSGEFFLRSCYNSKSFHPHPLRFMCCLCTHMRSSIMTSKPF